MDVNYFYDSLSDDYDIMIDFDNRFEKEEPFFKRILEKYELTNVLDFGCGTGFHSILLADLNLLVTGIDSSQKMIEKARLNSQRKNQKITFHNMDLDDFYNQGRMKFDAIFCMGNMLPHFLNEDKLNNAIHKFYNMLNTGGILVTQTLNYDKILENRERIVNIKEVDSKIFIRFYDFNESTIKFNILTLFKKESRFQHNLISTELYPIKYNFLKSLADCFKFKIDGIYGSMNFEEYDKEKSENLVMIMMV